jgi:transcriptional regulator with XRE-family HTH domain
MKNNSTRLCPSCGKSMEWRNYRHTEHVGNVKVVDSTAFAWQCLDCEVCDLSLEELAGYERRATALVLREGTHVNGSVIRSGRKALGIRQADLAVLLGCEPETVSRWETGARVMPRAEQLALVALLDGVEQGSLDIPAALLAARHEAAGPVSGPLELEVPPLRRAVG